MTFLPPSWSRLTLWGEQGFWRLTQVAGLAVVTLLVGIVVQIGSLAWPAIERFGFSFWLTVIWDPVRGEYGALALLWGTAISSLLALLIAVPMGVGTAILLSEDILPLSLRRGLTPCVDLLAGIPSVVYGYWGAVVLNPWLHQLGIWLSGQGWITLRIGTSGSLLAAGCLLGIMIVPIISAVGRQSLLALPPEWREASLAVGASRWTTIWRVLLPGARSGIGAGILLGLARAMAEAMAVTMVIGNANRLPRSLGDPSNTLAAVLANQFAEATGLQVAALMYVGLILFGLVLVVGLVAEGIRPGSPH
ncbi:MAG: phosphate ABC transporter permease subunit PstC [Cyanobacteriota bacterium]|nr:phosphate ABC transporter permease subunit PstC [Cyanobacteriota bacterium]